MTPLDRCRFLNENERLDLGDRTITAVRPPVFDNPTTRGMFDDRTGVFWSVDTFANPVTAPLEDARDISDADFADGQQLVAAASCRRGTRGSTSASTTPTSTPFGRCRSRSSPSCHAPAIRGDRIETALDVLRTLPLGRSVAAVHAPRPRAVVGITLPGSGSALVES